MRRRTRHSLPKEITMAVLLMRYCIPLGLYANRLRIIGLSTADNQCPLGTLVNLEGRAPWASVEGGWYACLCGQTGFLPAPPEQLTGAQLWQIAEVETCPACVFNKEIPYG